MMKQFVSLGVIIGLLAVAPVVMAQLPVDHEAAGVTVLVPDHDFFLVDEPNGSYWEPFTDIFGDGTAVVIAGTFPEDEGGMTCKVGFINTDGTVEEYWGFYADDGTPFISNMNSARTSGNPPRVACDRRPGGTRYVVGQETTVWEIDAFASDTRWEIFEYDRQMAACQLFNKTESGPDPITNVFDPIYGGGAVVDGFQNSQQIRFGGELRFLSNGNFVVVPEDQSENLIAGRMPATTIFDGETGEVIKGPFNGRGDDSPGELWSNVAAFNGGFCVRSQALMTIWDNDGNMQYMLDQDEFSTVADRGRSDDTRIASANGSNYVYIFGRTADGMVALARFDAVNSSAGNIVGVKEVYANEEDFWDDPTIFQRADVAVDDYDNVCVIFDEKYSSADGLDQIVARIFNSAMEPVTPVFYAFVDHDAHDAVEQQGFMNNEANVSMDTQRIIIAANGTFTHPDGGLTADQQTYAIVLENPLKPESVTDWAIH